MSEAFDTNVTITIQLGFGSGPLAASPTWTDVTAYSRGFDTRRGRASVDSTFQSGTAIIRLDNRDGRFDPNNTSSPYSPNVVLGVPVKITATYSATPYILFYGHVDRWPLSYPEKGKDAIVELSCVENMRLIQNIEQGAAFGNDDTGSRIYFLLSNAGWPMAMTSIDTGIVEIALPDTTGMEFIRQCEQAEHGTVFVAGNGYFTFHNRTHFAGGPSSTGTYGAGNLEYADVTLAYDDDTLTNKAYLTGASGSVQSASDSTSVSAYGPHAYEYTNNVLTDPQALNLAEWIVGANKDMAVRVTGMSLAPQSDPTNLWPAVLGLDLRDAITVTVDPPGAGDTLSQLVTVESLSHSVRPKVWSVSVGCHPLSTLETLSTFWVLGTSNDLDTDTALA